MELEFLGGPPGDHVLIDSDGRLDSGFISQGGNYPKIPRFDTENSQGGQAKGSVVTDLPSESEYTGVANLKGVAKLDLGITEVGLEGSLQSTPKVFDMPTGRSHFGNTQAGQLLASKSGDLPGAGLRLGRGGLGIASANDIARRDQVLPIAMAGPAHVRHGGSDARATINLGQIKKIQIEQAQINFADRNPTPPLQPISETQPEVDPE